MAPGPFIQTEPSLAILVKWASSPIPAMKCGGNVAFSRHPLHRIAGTGETPVLRLNFQRGRG